MMSRDLPPLLCISEHPELPWFYDTHRCRIVCGLGPCFASFISEEVLIQIADDPSCPRCMVRALGHLVAISVAIARETGR